MYHFHAALNRPVTQFLLALLVAMLLLVKPVLLRPAEYPSGDALRYIAVALNLHEHGVIADDYVPGRAPEPGLVIGGPLIAAELAAVMAIDGKARDSLRCGLLHPAASSLCNIDLSAMKVMHWLELTVFACCVWLTAMLITARLGIAWLAMILALLCREVAADAGQALTEPLAYALIGLFSLLWIRAWQKTTSCRWFACGVALGLLVLIKPSAASLLPLTYVLLAWLLLFRCFVFSKAMVAASFSTLGCIAIIAPWLLHNQISVGVLALSDPNYLVAALSHRVAYNAMSWREWFVGWVYYLPDFGDSLAARLFGVESYERLGWNQQSYYIFGRDQLHAAALNAAPLPGTARYLFDEYVLTNPLKHAAVSLLLAWRGLFVGKIWGLIAVLLLPAALTLTALKYRRPLLLLLIPGIALLFAQAMLSVSIPRYNNMLVLPLAIAAAILLTAMAGRGLLFYRANAKRRDRL